MLHRANLAALPTISLHACVLGHRVRHMYDAAHQAKLLPPGLDLLPLKAVQCCCCCCSDNAGLLGGAVLLLLMCSVRP